MCQNRGLALVFTGLLWSVGLGVSPARGDELFGMHLQSQRRHAEAFPAMAHLGVTWVRTHIGWFRLEPRPGQFDWQHFDEVVADAERHRLSLLVTLAAISPWGSTQLPSNIGQPGYHATYPPKDLGQYAAFVRAVVGRYKGKGIAWQIENEVNARDFWGGTREDYLTMLKAAYAAAHQADPQAVVLPAGLAGPWPHMDRFEFRMQRHEAWLNATLDSRAYDAIDLHNYFLPGTDNPWRFTFEQHIERYEGWLKARNVGVPLWISEAGVPSAPIAIREGRIPFAPEQQARDLERIYAIARRHRTAHVFWLKLVDTSEHWATHMGLLTAGHERKPAAAAYRRLATGR